MFDGNYYEHIVKQKVEGGLLAKKVCLILAYVIIFIMPLYLIISLCPIFLWVPFILVILTLTVISILLTWKYTSVEFEYSISSDTISFVNIYGKKSRKGKIEICIKDFSEIGKYTDAAEKHLEEVVIERDYLFISHLAAEHLYYGLFDDDGEKCIVYFEATDKAISLIKKYNPSAIRAYEREIKKYSSQTARINSEKDSEII